MKHRKPNGAQRAVAGTSMPLAAAAVVATLLAAPAGAVPNEPTTPTTPAPAPVQPGTPDETPETPAPQPGAPAEEPQEPSKPTPSQPGVTTPDPDEVKPDPKKDPKLAAPTQPGVTTPRVAPLPVPGQQAEDLPAAAVDPADPNAPKPAEPGTPAQPGAVQPKPQSNVPAVQPESQENLVQEPPRWQAPRLQAAPAAPVVEMEGPRTEVSANVDGGALIPGFVANTHHFNNQAGYVGTIGYRTPTGAGEAGVSVEYLDTNSIKITSYTGGEGLADNKNSFLLDTTQANAAKAAVEQWIAAQPGGAAALEAAARVTLPSIIPAGDVAPQTVNVGGITTQWGGSVQY